MMLTLLGLTATAQAETFSIDNGKVSFSAPPGFQTMPTALIKIKFPRNAPPRHVLTNDSTQTTIAFDQKPHKIPQSEIDATRKSIAMVYGRLFGGFEMKQNKTIQLAGQKWIFLEFTSNTIDTNVRNMFLATGYKGKMIVFNFNSTKKEFPKYQAALRKSIKTIRLH